MSVFFTSWKTILKSWLDTSSIASYSSSSLSFFILLSRQLLDTWWIDRESSYLLDSFSTVGGQVELLFLHLMVCSSTPPGYLYLSTTISSIPSLIAVSILLKTCIYQALLRAYIISSCDPPIIFFDLSLGSSLIFLSQTLSFHSNLVSQGFFKLFQDFLLLVSF